MQKDHQEVSLSLPPSPPLSLSLSLSPCVPLSWAWTGSIADGFDERRVLEAREPEVTQLDLSPVIY